MRLPHEKDVLSAPIDIERTKEMVDSFIHAGGKYFDTAFVYKGSEEAAKLALCDRYPREDYYLASKLNASQWACKDENEAKSEIYSSLKKAGCGYFDFYLLHGLEEGNLGNYEKYGIWDYIKGLKKEGLIRHWGFSFHDKADLLDKLLTEHPDVEFVQLQINYSDWNDPHIQSRANYEVCVKHDIPVVVMEPVKGGVLSNPPQAVLDIFHQADANASPASWAVRFVASLPQVMMVLSGMSNSEQMNDNLSYMKNFKPLSEAEQKTIDEAREALSKVDRIPCTACHYCTPGCPQGIHIPEIFSVMNMYKMYGNLSRAREDYTWRPGGAPASECIQCGQCQEACPQHLPIISLLEEVAGILE